MITISRKTYIPFLVLLSFFGIAAHLEMLAHQKAAAVTKAFPVYTPLAVIDGGEVIEEESQRIYFIDTSSYRFIGDCMEVTVVSGLVTEMHTTSSDRCRFQALSAEQQKFIQDTYGKDITGVMRFAQGNSLVLDLFRLRTVLTDEEAQQAERAERPLPHVYVNQHFIEHVSKDEQFLKNLFLNVPNVARASRLIRCSGIGAGAICFVGRRATIQPDGVVR